MCSGFTFSTTHHGFFVNRRRKCDVSGRTREFSRILQVIPDKFTHFGTFEGVRIDVDEQRTAEWCVSSVLDCLGSWTYRIARFWIDNRDRLQFVLVFLVIGNAEEPNRIGGA